MDAIVAIPMVVMGIGIAAIWTRDIVAGEQVDLTAGVFAARDPDSGALFWPHWLAEYATAAALIVGGIGLLLETGWAHVVSAAAAGALLYTSVNSLGWALARSERSVYAYPMLVGVIVGALVVGYLITA